MSRVYKSDALEGLENERHDYLEGVLSEGLANTDALACEEGHEGHGVVVAALSKTLRLIGVVVLAPLVFVVMQLVNIDDHHFAGTDLDSPDLHIIIHAERGADRQWRVDPQGLIEAVLQVIILSLIEGVHVKLLGQGLQRGALILESFKICHQALSCSVPNRFVLDHVAYGIGESRGLGESAGHEEGYTLVYHVVVIVLEQGVLKHDGEEV